MQKIDKKLPMPPIMAGWIKRHKNQPWNLKNDFSEGYDAIHQQLYKEQLGLCCYCCKSLVDEETRVEHLDCRSKYPKKTYEYDNLLLSCATENQCDKAKENKALPLTPLMNECDEEIKINFAGELVGNTHRAKLAIEILNLNQRKICNNRRLKYDEIIMLYLQNKEFLNLTETSTLEEIKHELNSFLNSIYGNTEEFYEIIYILKKITQIK